MRSKPILGVAAALVVLGGAGTGVAMAASDDGNSTVSGPEAGRATAAALDAAGGGRANSVERDAEDAATWEVEVTKLDGTTVDVRLDQGYGVVVIESDGRDADRGSEGLAPAS